MGCTRYLAEVKGKLFVHQHPVHHVGAVLSKRIRKAEVIVFEDLGPEAVRRLEVEEFPVVVINDCFGRDLYEEGIKQFAR